ncbi:MAG: hypothetical protein ABL983_02430 [Nitrospira sp.]
MNIPEYLLSPCAEKRDDRCRESYRCADSAKRNPETKRWHITMGHAGFNSETNNGDGYVSQQAAHFGIAYHLRGCEQHLPPERQGVLTADGLNPDDELIFTSPFSGKESTVSYRGPFQGKAMIWTGMTQYAVEYKYLRKA